MSLRGAWVEVLLIGTRKVKGGSHARRSGADAFFSGGPT